MPNRLLLTEKYELQTAVVFMSCVNNDVWKIQIFIADSSPHFPSHQLTTYAEVPHNWRLFTYRPSYYDKVRSWTSSRRRQRSIVVVNKNINVLQISVFLSNTSMYYHRRLHRHDIRWFDVSFKVSICLSISIVLIML